MKFSENQQSIVVATLLLFLLIAGTLLLSTNRTIARVDLILYDLFLPLQAKETSDQIVVIAIDDASLDRLGRWPWTRQVHAKLLDRLTQYGAKAIGLDLLLLEPQLIPIEADGEMAQALEKNGRTILVVAPAKQSQNDTISELIPLPEFAISAAGLGHVDVELDIDGICRRFYLYAGIEGAHWPSLSMAMLQVGGEPPIEQLANEEKINTSNRGWQRRHQKMIPFPQPGSRPPSYSYVDVLNGRIPESAIRDKYVLVGVTASGLGDAISTPAALSHERTPGVELNAHILNGLLQGHSIREIAPAYQAAITLLFILLSTIIVTLTPLRIGFFAVAIIIVSVVLTTVALLVGWQIWYHPVIALTLSALSWPLWSLWQIGVQARLTQNLAHQLEHITQHHVASGLPNHGMLEKQLIALTESSRSGQSLSALMVIHFSWPGSANIILGKNTGDPTFKIIGDRLRRVCPNHCFIAHLYDNNFAVLIKDLADLGNAKLAAVDLLGKLKKPEESDDEKILLVPQIGLSIWPTDGQDAITLLRNAYTAMFKSRIDDSNHLCLYSADVGEELTARSQLEQALIFALERDEFTVHYQPQVNAQSEEIIGVEALIRWHSPQLGWVGPDTFIPVAEHVGLIKTIGKWVLETTCKQLHIWHQEGHDELRLAVNMSPLQFIIPGIDIDIREVVEKVGIAAGKLEIEVTESTFMRDLEGAKHIMHQIKQQGMSLSLDDFGTGYSSLNSLRHFPLDRLKIDRSFTQEIGINHEVTEIILVILNMGKRLELGLIAEGVETEDQATFLRNNGCDELQGYLYSRPLPVDEMSNLLNQQLNQPSRVKKTG